MKIRIISYIFVFVGAALLIVGYFMFQAKATFISESEVVDGVVIAIERRQSTDSDGHTSYSYYPAIEFLTKENQTISVTSNTGSNPSRYRVDDQVEVRYDASDPYHAEINSFMSLWMGVVIVTLFGIVFLLVGMGIIVGRMKRQKKRRRLLATGRKIQTKFSEVEKNTNVSINRKNPYRIITQYNEGNELFVFQSENIWFDPSSSIQEGQTIVVYVNRDRMSDYYMDVSFLPSPVS